MYGNESIGIFIDVKQDGTYLVIDNTKPRDSSVLKNPVRIFEGLGLLNIDGDALISALTSKQDRVEAKISSTTHVTVKNETVNVEINKDAMEARLVFVPGNQWFGREATREEIVREIEGKGVVFGVLTAVLERLEVDRPQGESILVAMGKLPVPGKDGYLKHYFNINEKSNKPKLLEDGSVDYKDTNYILKAEKGQVLVEAVPPEAGENGVNVRGEETPYKQGKICPRLPKGKNTYISDDGLKLLSEANGQIVLESNHVNVVQTLTIPGDVGPKTGNISFAGTVYVDGGVLPGFTITATDNVEVKGAVDSGNIESGADVNLFGGIKGMGKSVIRAGGNIYVRFAEHATLIADGNITSESIMHSEVRCKQHLVLGGKNGMLVGGSIYAGKSVTAKTIGSNLATATEIVVGNSPEFLERYNELDKAYKKLKSEYDNERLVESLKTASDEMRLRSLQARIYLRVDMEKMRKEMEGLLQLLKSTDGIVKASDVIHCGCRILVGGLAMKVKDDIPACSLRNHDGLIELGSYVGERS